MTFKDFIRSFAPETRIRVYVITTPCNDLIVEGTRSAEDWEGFREDCEVALAILVQDHKGPVIHVNLIGGAVCKS